MRKIADLDVGRGPQCGFKLRRGAVIAHLHVDPAAMQLCERLVGIDLQRLIIERDRLAEVPADLIRGCFVDLERWRGIHQAGAVLEDGAARDVQLRSAWPGLESIATDVEGREEESLC